MNRTGCASVSSKASRLLGANVNTSTAPLISGPRLPNRNDGVFNALLVHSMHGPRFSAVDCARQKGAVERDGCSEPARLNGWRGGTTAPRAGACRTHRSEVRCASGPLPRHARWSRNQVSFRCALDGEPSSCIFRVSRCVDVGSRRRSGDEKLRGATTRHGIRWGSPEVRRVRTDDRRRSVRACGCKGPVRRTPADENRPARNLRAGTVPPPQAHPGVPVHHGSGDVPLRCDWRLSRRMLDVYETRCACAGLSRHAERVRFEGPFRSASDLYMLEALWRELHAHHLDVAHYPYLVHDAVASWERRRAWYERLLVDGGTYFVARDDGRLVGYAFALLTPGADDTFDVHGGIIELVSLVVAESTRGVGVGRLLVDGVRDLAIAHDVDTLRVAVMVGNSRARNSISRTDSEPAKKSSI